MNQTQQALENTYHRAGAPSSLLYERTPVIGLTTGTRTQEILHTYEPINERENRTESKNRKNQRMYFLSS